jgi:signal transduction histidine kinase
VDPQEWKLLIVDDEADIREVMALALEDAGYHVETASDGAAGLRLCGIVLPQIVVTDIRMPAMDGLALLNALKEQYPDVEVIVMTAYGEMEQAIRALQLDASDFITKPVNADALTLALQRARDRFIARKKLKDYAALLEQEVEDQARLLHQDKMLSLGRLAASVVHEINNPLSGILNYIRLMHRIISREAPDAAQREKFSRYLELVETETERCSQIVSGLLAFSRKSEPAFTKVRIEEVIDRCVALSRHKLELQQIVLETRVPKGLPLIRGDMNQLQQCIINLVFNAIDAMPDGGTLTIGAHFSSEEQFARITVSDTGPGVPASMMKDIFQPFYTTKRDGQGVGLGLSTVSGIMDHHHGTLSVENAPAGGAVFTLTLPLADKGAPA